MTPCDHGLQGQDAGDVDVHRPRGRETGLEHRVQADDVEQVETVVSGHLIYICQILQRIISINFQESRQCIADKLLYIPNDDKQNYPFCKLQLVVKTLDTILKEQTKHI